jgi:hypothetical protein
MGLGSGSDWSLIIRIEKIMTVSPRAFNGRFITISVTLIIVGLLIYMLVGRLGREMDNLERTHFELRLAELKSALLLKQLEIRTRGFKGNLKRLNGANPMQWIKGWPTDLPAYYRGEFELSRAEGVKGYWVYDPKQQVIAYLPNAIQNFELTASGEWTSPTTTTPRKAAGTRWLKYQVKVYMDGSKLESLALEFVP